MIGDNSQGSPSSTLSVSDQSVATMDTNVSQIKGILTVMEINIGNSITKYTKILFRNVVGKNKEFTIADTIGADD